MINCTYIIGGNIELFITAEILPAEPDVDFHGGVEIEEITLENGAEVETDGIYIDGTSLHDLLEQAVLDAAENW